MKCANFSFYNLSSLTFQSFEIWFVEIVSTPAVEDETIFVPRCNWHHPLRQDPRCIARLSNLTIHFLCNISTKR